MPGSPRSHAHAATPTPARTAAPLATEDGGPSFGRTPLGRALLDGRRRVLVALAAGSLTVSALEATVVLFVLALAGQITGLGASVGSGLGPVGPWLEALFAIPPATALAVAVGAILLRLVARIAMAVAQQRFSAGVDAQLRARIYRRFLEAPTAARRWLDRGRAEASLTVDLSYATLWMSTRLQLLTTLPSVALFAIAAFAITPGIAAFATLGAAALFLALRPLSRYAGGLARQAAAVQTQLLAQQQESIELRDEIRAAHVEPTLLTRWDAALVELRRLSIRAGVVRQVLGAATTSAVLLAIVGLAGWAALADPGRALPIGAAIGLLWRAGSKLISLQSLYHLLRTARPHLDRLATFDSRLALPAPPSPDVGPGQGAPAGVDTCSTAGAIATLGATGTPTFTGIQLVDASFGYDPLAPVLRGLSLSLEPGQVLTISGPNGAGKSTLIGLLTGSHVPDAGRVQFNGVPYHALPPGVLGRVIGVLPQEPRLLDGTIAENVRFWRPAVTDRAIEQALAAVGLDEVVAAIPGGVNGALRVFGNRLSVGQRQRLVLARALVASPPVLVLDEPTSAQDAASRAHLTRALLTPASDALPGGGGEASQTSDSPSPGDSAAISASSWRTLVLVTHDPIADTALLGEVLRTAHIPGANASTITATWYRAR